jgi:hypothetical protein
LNRDTQLKWSYHWSYKERGQAYIALKLPCLLPHLKKSTVQLQKHSDEKKAAVAKAINYTKGQLQQPIRNISLAATKFAFDL